MTVETAPRAMESPRGLKGPLMGEAELTKRFTAHEVGDGSQRAMADLREVVRIAASAIVELVPESREQSLAITKLEEAVFWANAGIARYGANGLKADEGGPA